MENNPFIIYVDRLEHEEYCLIEETLPSEWLQTYDNEVQVVSPLQINVKAYLAGSHLILDLDITTTVSIPCSICNEPAGVALTIKENSQSIKLSKIPSALFDCSQMIRDAVLLKIPHYAECGGNCPERSSLSSFLAAPE